MLEIRVARRINSMGAIETMVDTMIVRGVPEHMRSDNGPEMTAKIVRQWLGSVGAKTLYIALGSPWENDYCEIFKGKLRDDPLNGEIFYEGGQDHHRAVAQALQHDQAALIAYIQTGLRLKHQTRSSILWSAVRPCSSLYQPSAKYSSGHRSIGTI